MSNTEKVISLSGRLFRDMILNAAAVLNEKKQSVNELNVFPVPDGDTGTNMSLTMGNAAAALSDAKYERGNRELGEIAGIVSGALLRGARGNSGVILSLLFRGFAQSLKGKESAAAADFANALDDGVKAAYSAVMKPAEGTILTVSRLAKDAALEYVEAYEGDSGIEFAPLLERIIDAAKTALADTVNLNPVLKKAGVVDSGGVGYVYILEAMLAAVNGEHWTSDGGAETLARADFSAFSDDDITFSYCTEFIVTRTNKKDANNLRAFLNALGDSIVIVDDDELIKVHVHTDQPGVVLTEALTYGTLLTTKIENMREQHTEKLKEEISASEPDFAEIEKAIGVVSVCAGDGLEEVFKNLGVDRTVNGGQTMNPSTEDILREINRVPASTVFVLPNNSNIVLAANQCVGAAHGRKVIVIPTTSVPQGVSALLAFDPDAGAANISAAMNEARENVRTISVTKAARDSSFDGAGIKEGDFLAMLEGKLLFGTETFASLLKKLVETVGEYDPEFITIYTGACADSSQTAELDAALSDAVPNAEVTVVTGGQPVYEFIISAE
ncbi:MAG: DAK2 domain-containing protein [Oscillospiraceae bacterium]|jgi:DAK2 domain fusion protein YloV|nr:DAK2 domain-containing protein [Oscillospiraceae bacterium]